MTQRSSSVDGVNIRHFRPADEEAIIALFSATYQDYGGYVPRDKDQWRWSVLQRPGVEAENILLCVDGADRARAYGVLSNEGRVLEFAVTPDAPTHLRRQMAAALLEGMEAMGRAMGLEAISADLPRIDGPIREAAESAGYRMEPVESLQLVVVDLVALLLEILRDRSEELLGLGGRTIVLEMAPGRCRFLSHDRVRIRTGSPVTVESATGREPESISVGIDLTTLMGVVFQGDDPDKLIRSGKVRVRPEDHGPARTLLNAMAVSAPWYIPHSDGR
ncbi:MAG: hypothetical protein WD960_10635 [Gemmatimonadota bacterium]